MDWRTLSSFALGNERTLVTRKSCEAQSTSQRFTRDQCPFISQCKRKQEAQRATYCAPEYNVRATFLRNWSRQIFLFTDRPEKHKLGRGPWDLASCQVLLNSVQRFQRRSKKSLSQSEARAAILFFFNRPEKHKLGRRCWDLASCQVWLVSVPRFQMRSRKCLSQSEARATILFFRSARKTQTW